jgi:GNAT superfamily N-acetyltransferase
MDRVSPLHGRVTIRPVEMRDRPSWRHLYRQYAHFYQAIVTDAMLDRSWSWLMDAQHPLEALVAQSQDSVVLGLAHFRACPDPLIAQDIGFLDDLFVAVDQRGLGIGRRLIMGVASTALARGWPVVRWVTADTNAQARQLYDRLAQATRWVTYDLQVPRKGEP